MASRDRLCLEMSQTIGPALSFQIHPFRKPLHGSSRSARAVFGLSPHLLGLSLAEFAGENLAEMMPDILVDAPSFEGSLLNPTREAAQSLHSREAVSHMPPTPVAAHLEGLIPVLIKAGMSRYASLQSQPSNPAPSQRAAKPEPQLVKPEAKPGAQCPHEHMRSCPVQFFHTSRYRLYCGSAS